MKRWVGQVALVLSGCGIAFVLVEMGLRLFGISYPYFYIPDELTGFSLKPGAEGLWRKEGSRSV
ncbi:MAG: SGNH/GDSL hydrolase family protein, partial [Nitrospirota bacterium]|nr:SGNH/GDSL hydrolase family protein [Nitrospirota bacterium]